MSTKRLRKKCTQTHPKALKSRWGTYKHTPAHQYSARTKKNKHGLVRFGMRKGIFKCAHGSMQKNYSTIDTMHIAHCKFNNNTQKYSPSPPTHPHSLTLTHVRIHTNEQPTMALNYGCKNGEEGAMMYLQATVCS